MGRLKKNLVFICFCVMITLVFPIGGVMAKEKQKLVSTKRNEMIDAGFFKFLNGMEMRIFNLAVSQINPKRSVDQARRFEFTVKDFLDYNAGLSDKNNVYSNVKTAVKNLSRVWVSVKPLDGYDSREVSLLTARDYAENQGRFSVEFNPEVMPYLTDIQKKYTSFLLDTFGTLKSEHSLKLYELFSRWAFEGGFTVAFVDLREMLGIGDKYDRWNNFNQWVLKPAIKEINTKTNLKISMDTLRNGRSIEKIKFSVFDKSKAQAEKKRPKFPHKNKYGQFVKLDRQNPKNSSHEYGLYARDCLKILESFYQKIEDIPNEDLLFYWIFLAINASNKSKLGNKKAFTDELKKRGYKIVECELKRIGE